MKKKVVVSVILSAIIVASMSIGAFAAENLTVISAYLNHAIKVTLDGEQLDLRDAQGNKVTPITYQGSTYLPVRAVAEAAGINVEWDGATQTVILGDQYDAVLEFPAHEYPQTAAHIASAILAGESAICTIDRDGADERREAALAGIPTRDGYDRDEWPMAMCAEGGAGADVAYVESSDNRGAGAWVGNALEQYPDGTRVKFVVTFGDLDADEQRNTPAEGRNSGGNVEYASCAAAKEAGAAPLHKGDPGYSEKLDRDGDGVACE